MLHYPNVKKLFSLLKRHWATCHSILHNLPGNIFI